MSPEDSRLQEIEAQITPAQYLRYALAKLDAKSDPTHGEIQQTKAFIRDALFFLDPPEGTPLAGATPATAEPLQVKPYQPDDWFVECPVCGRETEVHGPHGNDLSNKFACQHCWQDLKVGE